MRVDSDTGDFQRFQRHGRPTADGHVDSACAVQSRYARKRKRMLVTIHDIETRAGFASPKKPTPEPDSLPTFSSEGKRFRVVTNDTVVLPCDVINPGIYVLAWKKGIAVLTAGNTKVSPDERIRLVDGNNLEIRDIQTNDAGNYVCQIATMKPREISHTVEILVPSRIKSVSSGGTIDTKKDSLIKLNCEADGNPVPNITWTRKNNVLPNGERNMTGDTYIIQSATRHDAGVYICTAYNSVGQPAEQTITVNILYPPEIRVERVWVHSGEGNEALLVCIVNAEPLAEVSWYRDTLKLDTNERRITEVRGSRHTLIVRKVQASDFGNYSCVADNVVGKTRAYVELSGKPNPVKINSNKNGRHQNNYNISWSVDSYTPIEEFKLYYRKVPLPDESPSDSQTQYQWPKPPLGAQKEHEDFPGGPIYGYNSMRNEWNDVILPAVPSEQYTHRMSYNIRGLDTASEYEAKVMAKNRFGWTPMSDVFTFTTSATPEIEVELRDFSSTSSINGFNRRSYNIIACVFFTALYLAFGTNV
ncbi:Fibronectin type III,Immunoglobulin subtype,Immunoglobulin-like domain,Immunoglobulin-like [Cinara cedri]|uniref:Fibronectin type III,Immunoglobulin subtype,Immunoglobulin-like domain,Immunoglobulin-like n=1 Tax=Cinara cedri TaxID=506608 RepID=A0A5E4M5M9_9HEMI|nr:Fibronectin type III,Immunoglobulin subtype,Immunoglobulin-like domain,Immunoglobulin-like [Cinara cedri]